jgi:hypothetical protein
VIRSYEVDAAQMCDALSVVPGVDHVALEFDGRGGGVLRIRLAAGADGDEVVGAAVAGLRRRFGPGIDASRLRLTGPRGRPVVAVLDGTSTRSDEARRSALDAGRGSGRRPTSGPDAGPDGPRPTWDTAGATAAAVPARVAVEDVEVVTERTLVRATVRLRSGSTLHTGSAKAAATTSGGQRAVVCATANAIEQVIGGSVRLDVEAVDLLQLGTDRVGVVVVTLIAGDRVDQLTSSALVREDRSDTLVRATLDALNRRALVVPSAG